MSALHPATNNRVLGPIEALKKTAWYPSAHRGSLIRAQGVWIKPILHANACSAARTAKY
jgi:hypothetical protein